jgi:zinc transporter
MMSAERNIVTDDPKGDADAGLIFACVLDGKGGCADLAWEAASVWTPTRPGEVLWLHFDRTVANVGVWLEQSLNLSEATLETLLSNETRPRAFCEGDSLITILRGINFNPGAEPEDMIAMQIWGDQHRVITLRRRRLQTPLDILADLRLGDGPRTAGDLVASQIERLVSKINVAIVEMNTRIDEMEAAGDDADADEMLRDISDIRRNCLALKRFMSPQYEALVDIRRAAPPWMSESNLQDIRETIDRLRKYMEDLDVSKESAIVLQDDLDSRAANRTNKTMYMLSIVAAVFLPLSFVTGLLGINVGGMPGVNSGIAFWVTVAILLCLFGLQLYIFRKLKWL